MSTLTIEYGIKSEIVSNLLSFFSKLAGAKVKREYTATEEEIEEIKKSKASGIHSGASELKKIINEQLCTLNTQTNLNSQSKK